MLSTTVLCLAYLWCDLSLVAPTVNLHDFVIIPVQGGWCLNDTWQKGQIWGSLFLFLSLFFFLNVYTVDIKMLKLYAFM